MESPYAPYSSLQELLDAAGVSVMEMDRYSTAQLLERAKKSTSKKSAGRPLKQDRPAMAIRSVYIPYELEKATDAKARASGTNLNQVVRMLLEDYVNGRT